MGYLGYSKRAAPRDVINGSMGDLVMALDLYTYLWSQSDCPIDLLVLVSSQKGVKEYFVSPRADTVAVYETRGCT